MLYIFDIDGTLIKPYFTKEVAKKRVVDTPTDDYDYNRVEVMPNRIAQIKLLAMKDAHACFALATNQGGVAFGFVTVASVEDKLARVVNALDFFYGCAFSVHVCYNHPDATVEQYRYNDPRRKPGPGMLDEAMQAHRILNRHGAVYVGDLDTDKQAAMAAGIAYMYAEDFFAPRGVTNT